jgi:hypothetical protein
MNDLVQKFILRIIVFDIMAPPSLILEYPTPIKACTSGVSFKILKMMGYLLYRNKKL